MFFQGPTPSRSSHLQYLGRRPKSDPEILITGVTSLSGERLGGDSDGSSWEGDAKLVCPICGKVVHGRNRRQNMANHMLIHSGLRPHKCCFCSYSSTQLGNVRRHIRNVHKIDQDSESSVISLDSLSDKGCPQGTANAATDNQVSVSQRFDAL